MKSGAGRIGSVVLCFAMALLVGCGSGTDESGKKKAASEKKKAEKVVRHEARGTAQNSACADELRDVFFISRATLPVGAVMPEAAKDVPPDVEHGIGFAVGEANTILKTADGGKTWRRVVERKEDGPYFDSVLFRSPAQGWAVSRDVLLYTSDAGETWTPAAALPDKFYYFGPHTATATSYFQMQPPTCSGTAYKTKDGGKTWVPLKAGLPHNDYESVFFLDDMHGWLAGNYGRFAKTEDGGQTWREMNIPDGGHNVQIQFATLETGWLRPYGGHQGGILATADGGKTWRTLNADIPSYRSIRDMQFLTEKVGFLLAQEDVGKTKVLRTMDGGTTWEIVGKHDTDLFAISFVDPNHGWVVGADGCVFRYAL